MKHGRRMLNAAFETPLDHGLELEGELGNSLTDTDDYTEGFEARLEGRSPDFEGE